MDSETIEKWKLEYQNERRVQTMKAKELQKETLQRRKAIEIKAQLELAKEEKRRQDALAERRAQHIEATMRFQRGLKNFKINREKVSLDDILKKIQPVRSRLNSAESDRVKIYNPELAGLFGSSRSNGSLKSYGNLKKSSSFDNLSNLSAKVTTQNTSMLRNPSASNVPNYQYLNFVPNDNNNMLENNTKNVKISTQPKINTTTINRPNQVQAPVNPPASANSKANHFREMLSENQRTIQDVNKLALKEFQSYITNELNANSASNLSNFSIGSNNSNTANRLNTYFGNEYDNKPRPALLNPPKPLHNDADGDSGTIVSIEDIPSDNDSLETDSLLEVKFDLPEPTKQKVKTANKIDGEDDTRPDRVEVKIGHTPAMNSNSLHNFSNAKNENGTKEFKHHFFTNMTTSEFLPRNQKSYLTNHQQTVNKTTENSNGNHLLSRNNSKQIKSILKRSASLDNNAFSIISLTNQSASASNLNQAAGNLKDSLDLANSRLNSASKVDALNESGRKKSVRFAPPTMSDQEDEAAANEVANEELNKTAVTANAQVKPNGPMVIFPIRNAPNGTGSRISSTNSIRRPVLKPRTFANKPQKSVTEFATTIQQNLNTNAIIEKLNTTANHEKPPIYPMPSPGSTVSNQPVSPGSMISPNALVHMNTGSYSQISQKRREYLQKNPKAFSPKSAQMKATIQQQLDANHDAHEKSETSFTAALRAAEITKENGFVPISPQTHAEAADFQNDQHEPRSTQMTQNGSLYRQTLLQQHQLNQLRQVNDQKLLQPTQEIRKPEMLNIVTRIPMSPKTNLKSNYYNYPDDKSVQGQNNLAKPTQAVQPQQAINTISDFNSESQKQSHINMSNLASNKQLSTNQPASSFINTPAATNTVPFNSHNMQSANIQPANDQHMSRTNIRFAYLNSTLNNQTMNVNSQLPPQPPQRVQSADSGTNQHLQKNLQNSPSIHLEIKYPLYSNFQQQTVTNQPSGADESMDLFLKAEEMSGKDCTESQIYNTVKEPNPRPNAQTSPYQVQAATNNRTPMRMAPVSLSIEEQNVKNSIMRLNERLNMLTNNNNNNRRFNYTQDDYSTRAANYDAYNRYKSANISAINTNTNNLAPAHSNYKQLVANYLRNKR